MSRWLFNIAAGASTVLCVGMIVLWIACHGKPGSKQVRIPGSDGKYAFLLRDGSVALASRNQPIPAAWGGGIYRSYLALPPGPVSFWILTLFFLCLPVIWLLVRRRTIPPGHCQQCGYDLRATPERCPECGAIPAAPKGAAA